MKVQRKAFVEWQTILSGGIELKLLMNPDFIFGKSGRDKIAATGEPEGEESISLPFAISPLQSISLVQHEDHMSTGRALN